MEDSKDKNNGKMSQLQKSQYIEDLESTLYQVHQLVKNEHDILDDTLHRSSSLLNESMGEINLSILNLATIIKQKEKIIHQLLNTDSTEKAYTPLPEPLQNELLQLSTMASQLSKEINHIMQMLQADDIVNQLIIHVYQQIELNNEFLNSIDEGLHEVTDQQISDKLRHDKLINIQKKISDFASRERNNPVSQNSMKPGDKDIF